MIECPNCGMDNAPDRAFCRICGERLPQQAPTLTGVEAGRHLPGDSKAGPQGGLLGLDWLMTGDELAAPPPEAPEEVAPLPSAPVEEAVEPAIPEGSEEEAKEPSRTVATSTFLPAWLRGVEVAEEVAEPPAPLWDEDLDFSDLPDWPSPEEEGKAPTLQQSDVPEWASFELDDPIQSPEREGSGLLVGVRGPIPIEPVIALLHEAPTFPGRDEVPPNQDAANLFARIAGGAIAPEPIVLPKAPLRGAAIFHLILLVAIVLPFLFADISIFGNPPRLAVVSSFGNTLRTLPRTSTVLLSFDYEGGMSDELEPAAIATLNHLRKLAEAEGDAGRNIQLIAVSTTPQGAALAEQARVKSTWGNEDWLNMGFLPGGTIGVRDILTQPFTTTAPEEEVRAAARRALEDLALIVVIGSDTTVVQRWIEQAGVEEPGMPMLAIAPAIAESSLTPYLASGQLDGLLAGIAGTASYEYHELGGFSDLVEEDRLIAWRRIDALTVAALLALVVILAGNIVGSGRVDLGRFRRKPEEE